RYWNALTEGGKEDRCGWLKDKYGVSWQVIPKQLGMLLSHPDKAKASRAMQSMMGMRKIDIAELERASEG
ncbi:MAG TPA: VOC family protein, partial [Chitinophagales bacterium]|nr:VOC family protein [Chitinophagales bacterium]